MLSRDDVAKLFQAMRLSYGAKFDRQWENVGMTELLVFWSDRLQGVPRDAFRRAVDAMFEVFPSFPPTLPEFAGLCRQFIRPEPVAAIDWHVPRDRKAAVVHLKSLREILEGRL